MGSFILTLVCAGCLVGVADPAPVEESFLYQPAYALDEVLRDPAEPYLPQPGDIFFCSDRMWFWQITFNMACTGHPHHSGIVFARSDGRLAVLEAGPHDGFYVEANDWLPHFKSYEPDGPIWIRKRKVPLTPEESARLTAWAEAQDGKRFALVRLAGQLTPFRSRGPLRTWFLGGPHGARSSYFCCELLMESCVAAGLLDPATTRPCATYPKDVFFDQSYNLYINKHLNLSPWWYPPARWSSHTEVAMPLQQQPATSGK